VNLPGTRGIGKFFGILLEVESRGHQPIGNCAMEGIVGKVHLLVAKVAAPPMDTEIRSGDHREIIRVRRMEQRMKIREAGTLLGKSGEVGILYGALVVDILEHDDEHAVEMVRLRVRGGTGSYVTLFLR